MWGSHVGLEISAVSCSLLLRWIFVAGSFPELKIHKHSRAKCSQLQIFYTLIAADTFLTEMHWY